MGIEVRLTQGPIPPFTNLCQVFSCSEMCYFICKMEKVGPSNASPCSIFSNYLLLHRPQAHILAFFFPQEKKELSLPSLSSKIERILIGFTEVMCIYYRDSDWSRLHHMPIHSQGTMVGLLVFPEPLEWGEYFSRVDKTVQLCSMTSWGEIIT